MGNSRTLDEKPRKFTILSAGCEKCLGIYRSFSDLAKSVHWTVQKFLGIRGKFMDA